MLQNHRTLCGAEKVWHKGDGPICMVLFGRLHHNNANKLHPKTLIIFVYLHGCQGEILNCAGVGRWCMVTLQTGLRSAES